MTAATTAAAATTATTEEEDENLKFEPHVGQKSVLIADHPRERYMQAFIFVFCFVVWVMMLTFNHPYNPEGDESVHYTEFRREETIVGGGLHSVSRGYPYVYHLESSFAVKTVDIKLSSTSYCDKLEGCSEEETYEQALVNFLGREFVDVHEPTEEKREDMRLEFGLYQRLENGTIAHVCCDDEVDFEIEEELDYLQTFEVASEFKEISHLDDLFFLFHTNSSRPISFMVQVDQFGAIADARLALGCLIMIFVYGMIISEVVHRTVAALLGSFVALFALTVVQGAPELDRVTSWLDVGTLALLFSMMLIVNALSTTGVFQWTAVRAVQLSGGDMRRLLTIMCLLTALFSMFLDNVTTILLFVPVTVELCRLLHLDPVPFLVSEVMFSNLGGTATLIGDPPNILIGSALPEDASFVDFLIHAMPGIILTMAPCMYYLIWYYGDVVPAGKRSIDIAFLKGKYVITDEVMLGRVGIILSFVLLGFFSEPVHGLHSVWIAVAGGVGVTLVAGHHHLQHLLMHIEWETLLFFAGLFVIVEVVRELGLIKAIGETLAGMINGIEDEKDRLTGGVVLIMWASAFASAVLDNIPFTATMIQVIVKVSEDSNIPLGPLIWALSFGACLGGNATLVGASANLVMAGMAAKEKVNISFKTFTKTGFPIMMISVTTCMIYMLLRYCT